MTKQWNRRAPTPLDDYRQAHKPPVDFDLLTPLTPELKKVLWAIALRTVHVVKHNNPMYMHKAFLGKRAVIDECMVLFRRGLIDAEFEITEKGRAWL